MDDNISRAVELLNNAIRLGAHNGMKDDCPECGVINNIKDAIALLDPPKPSREERIARELDDIERMLDPGAIKVSVRNIAAILREQK